MGWKGPSRTGEAGSPSAWEWGQDSESAITLGGPTWFLAEVKCGEGLEGSHGGHRLSPLTSGPIGCEGAMTLLVGNPKQSESVLVVRVQRGDNDRALGPFHGHHLGLSIPIPVLNYERVKLAFRDSPGKAQ